MSVLYLGWCCSYRACAQWLSFLAFFVPPQCSLMVYFQLCLDLPCIVGFCVQGHAMSQSDMRSVCNYGLPVSLALLLTAVSMHWVSLSGKGVCAEMGKHDLDLSVVHICLPILECRWKLCKLN